MSYGTCESAGEKAIVLYQDKRNNGGEGGLNKRTPKQNGCIPPPTHPHKGLRRRMNPNWTNLLTRVFIYMKKAIPEGERTHTPEIDPSLLIRRN